MEAKQNKKLSTDIYELTNTVNEIQKQHMEIESDFTRAIGIYGYFADINALELQNATIVAAETANEMWPSRAKFEKNVIAHAIIHNIERINAVPAQMKVTMAIPEKMLEKYLTNDKFILDNNNKYYIGGLEYHLPYDLIIQRNILSNQQKVWSARYDIGRKNPISKITNPYLEAPFQQFYNTEKYILVETVLYQVFYHNLERKLLTSNPIENKTFEFTFEDQLADFVVKVTEQGTTTYLYPIFEGIGIDQLIDDFCYYTYIEANRIRVRFDSLSYMPSINANVEVQIMTTRGSEGNFEYKENIFSNISSETYGYDNVSIFMIPNGDSEEGKDRKTVKELRRVLPKEALSRGSIAMMQDLINYFNILNTDMAKMEIRKKIDTQFERTYYAFLVLKDSLENVIPTNTIDLIMAKNTDFDTHDNRKYVIKPGSPIAYDGTVGRKISPDKVDEWLLIDKDKPELGPDPNKFVYTVPFMTVLSDDPLYMSFYLTVMSYVRQFNFTYINYDCPVQFIAPRCVWRRGYVTNPDCYYLDVSLEQNVAVESKLIEVDPNGEIILNNTKVIAVLYNQGEYDDINAPYRYAFGELVNYKKSTDMIFDYRFTFKSTDEINDDAKMKLKDMYVPGSAAKMDGFFSGKIGIKLYTLVKLEPADPKETLQVYGRYDLDNICPPDALKEYPELDIRDYSVTNMYDVREGVNTYINFSDIITSTAVANDIEGQYETIQAWDIKSVPVIGLRYGDEEKTFQEFIDELQYRKAYIDDAIYKLENNFKIDFKFFNTYGPSKTYSLDINGEKIIDRVNLTLYFEVKLIKASDVHTKEYIIRDIKQIIEDLNDMTNLHIPNLITELTNTYYPNSIEYIEFLGFNEYGPGVQHLYRNEIESVTLVPEFLTVNTTDDLAPDIQIRIV